MWLSAARAEVSVEPTAPQEATDSEAGADQRVAERTEAEHILSVEHQNRVGGGEGKVGCPDYQREIRSSP